MTKKGPPIRRTFLGARYYPTKKPKSRSRDTSQADEIARLRAEKAELTAENKRLRNILVQAHNLWRHEFVAAVEDAAGTLFARLSHTNTDPFARAQSDPHDSEGETG